MQTPVQIEFQGLRQKSDLYPTIRRHVAMLEGRFGRITTCRVLIKMPIGSRQSGRFYEVGVQLTLPNARGVNVGRARQDDERRADLNFAINDAFKRARRQLQDQARRIQGKVKKHTAKSGLP